MLFKTKLKNKERLKNVFSIKLPSPQHKKIWIFTNAFKENDQNGDYYEWKDANLIGIANIMHNF